MLIVGFNIINVGLMMVVHEKLAKYGLTAAKLQFYKAKTTNYYKCFKYFVTEFEFNTFYILI